MSRPKPTLYDAFTHVPALPGTTGRRPPPGSLGGGPAIRPAVALCLVLGLVGIGFFAGYSAFRTKGPAAPLDARAGGSKATHTLQVASYALPRHLTGSAKEREFERLVARAWDDVAFLKRHRIEARVFSDTAAGEIRVVLNPGAANDFMSIKVEIRDMAGPNGSRFPDAAVIPW